MTTPDRLLLALAALCGLGGVVLSAAAAHRPDSASLDTAARFLLLHAPAILALMALGAAGAVPISLARLAGAALLIGVILFSGDLTIRVLAGRPLFPFAAPAGGFLLMSGWGLLAIAALVRLRR